MNHIQLSHVSALIDLKWTKVAAEIYITNEKALRDANTVHWL